MLFELQKEIMFIINFVITQVLNMIIIIKEIIANIATQRRYYFFLPFKIQPFHYLPICPILNMVDILLINKVLPANT